MKYIIVLCLTDLTNNRSSEHVVKDTLWYDMIKRCIEYHSHVLKYTLALIKSISENKEFCLILIFVENIYLRLDFEVSNKKEIFFHSFQHVITFQDYADRYVCI